MMLTPDKQRMNIVKRFVDDLLEWLGDLLLRLLFASVILLFLLVAGVWVGERIETLAGDDASSSAPHTREDHRWTS